MEGIHLIHIHQNDSMPGLWRPCRKKRSSGLPADT